MRRQLVQDLATAQRGCTHWRVARALLRALELLPGAEAGPLRALAERITEVRLRAKAIAALAAPPTTPRDYFAP